MNTLTERLHRRSVLRSMAGGFGSLALAAVATGEALAEDAAGPLSPKQTHFAPRAKRVIMLTMTGAPSHVDTFDHKPALEKSAGTGRGRKLMPSPFGFRRRGEGGLWVSDLLPNIAGQADELCLLRGMHTDQPNHKEAQQAAHTGTAQFVRPSLGSWTVYGLGTRNTDLPGYVALGPAKGPNFGSGFLPSVYQATGVSVPGGSSRPGGMARPRGGAAAEAVPDIANPVLPPSAQRRQLDFLQKLNRGKLARDGRQPRVRALMESYELAFRMQSSMPELVDLSKETAATQALYGVGREPTDGFGRQCLMARRMVEAGVRFVELTHGDWDHHNDIESGLRSQCAEIDKPVAGLLADLKQRDLLKDTLVVWAGEFGRTPHAENGTGRGHNNKGYTTFLAGGGVKGGFAHGATDELGYEAVEGRTHTHDWHATILHLLGLDHERLTYRHAGRNFRLTDVAGKVAEDILA